MISSSAVLETSRYDTKLTQMSISGPLGSGILQTLFGDCGSRISLGLENFFGLTAFRHGEMLKGVFDEVWLATGDQNSSAYDQHRATAACLLSDTGADRRIRGQAECLPLETGDRKKPFAALIFLLDSYRTSN